MFHPLFYRLCFRPYPKLIHMQLLSYSDILTINMLDKRYINGLCNFGSSLIVGSFLNTRPYLPQKQYRSMFYCPQKYMAEADTSIFLMLELRAIGEEDIFQCVIIFIGKNSSTCM